MNVSDKELERLMVRAFAIWNRLKYAAKVRNAKASVKKAKASGSFLGRRKIRDDSKIAQLRDKGLTIRAIAKECGVSKTVVHRSLKESDR